MKIDIFFYSIRSNETFNLYLTIIIANSANNKENIWRFEFRKTWMFYRIWSRQLPLFKISIVVKIGLTNYMY